MLTFPTTLLDVQADQLAAEAVCLERRFSQHSYDGSAEEDALIVIARSHPILISAPHAVNQWRRGRTKLADMYTGALGLQLSAARGASVIAAARSEKGDPNYDAGGAYKLQLESLAMRQSVAFILDLHGMSRARPWQFAIGTNQGETLGAHRFMRDSLLETMHDSGFTNVLVDDPAIFSASGPNTIAHFSWRMLGIPSIQLEIHRDFREPDQSPERYAVMLTALARFIDVVSRAISQG